MALAITGYKAYAVEAPQAVTPQLIQYVSMTVTAANTDATWDIKDFAGTFWTAAGGSTKGAAAKALLQTLAASAEYSVSWNADFIRSRVRAAAASGAGDYAQAYTAGDNLPSWTFNAGNAPTAETLVFAFKMPQDFVAVTVKS